jgi:hypothetical protein
MADTTGLAGNARHGPLLPAFTLLKSHNGFDFASDHFGVYCDMQFAEKYSYRRLISNSSHE